MSISPFRLCVLFLLLIGFVLPISNSFAQTDATDEMQKKELVTRAPREADGVLEWKFEKGLSVKFTTDQTTSMEMEVGGQLMNTKTKALNELSLTIESIDEKGVASATNTIDRMLVSTESPMISFEFDSDSDDDGDGPGAELAKTIRPMVGQPISQKMRTDGKIFDVKIPVELLKGLKGNPMAAAMFSEKNFQDMVSKASLVFPKPNLDVGHAWTVTETMDMGPMKINTSTAYTYKGVADVDGKPLHVVVGKVTMDFAKGGQAEVDIESQDSTVTFFFDGVAGRTVKSELDQKMDMMIETGAQDISQKITQKLIMTVSDKK